MCTDGSGQLRQRGGERAVCIAQLGRPIFQTPDCVWGSRTVLRPPKVHWPGKVGLILRNLGRECGHWWWQQLNRQAALVFRFSNGACGYRLQRVK